MITIKKIAELAGVSSATVSKVINGKDQNISNSTRERVLEIVHREDYIPNGIAKSLRVKNTNTFGLIMPDVTNLFFSELAKGIEDAAEKKGYSVILCNSDNNETKEGKYFSILQEKKVDGIILTASDAGTNKLIEKCSIPIVLVDRDITINRKVGRITVDNELGAYMATSFLIKKGCKNIGFISSNTKNKTSAERLVGYERALKENGIKINKDITYYNNFQTETGYDGTLKILKNNQMDAIFCGNDLIAIGAMKALKELKIRVPDDIRIIGFDDILFSEHLEPSLTTIKQPIYELGQNAVNILVNLINNNENDITIVLDPILVERGSA